MRSSTSAESRLPGARRTALLLFLCSVVLPTVVVLRRGSYGSYFSSEQGDSDDDAFALLDPPPRLELPRLQKRAAAAPPGVEGTRVLVFVAREHGSAVELHVRTDDAGVSDVCSGASLADEAYAAAAERILWACTALGPPPEVEFLERASREEPVPGQAVPFIALVRAERLRGSKPPNLPFIPLQQLDDVAAASFAPGVADSLPAVRAYLAPWIATAGKKAGACGPPPAGQAAVS